MDICIASDDNYASIMEVVIISALENNKKAEHICIHIFEDRISEKKKKEIISIIDMYGRDCSFYDVNEAMDKLRRDLNNEWANQNSYVAYSRIFMSEMLPEKVNKFLYVDCDVLICGDLTQLFSTDIGNNVIAAVKDVLPYKYIRSLGLDNYYNSGVLLIDNRSWKANKISQKLIEYCESHQDDEFPDQDAINRVLQDKIFTLSPNYCVFYPENSFSTQLQYWGFGDKLSYYSVDELIDAKTNPIIIHFVDTIWGRPWHSNNINPYSKLWYQYYELLGEYKFAFKKKTISTNQKIFRLIERLSSKTLFAILYYIRKNQGIKSKIK